MSDPTLRQYEVEWKAKIDNIQAVSEVDVVRVMTAKIPKLVREYLAPELDENGTPIVIKDVRVHFNGVRRKTPLNGVGSYSIDELTVFVEFEGWFTEAKSPLPPLVIALVVVLIASIPLIIKGLIILGVGIVVIEILHTIRDITTSEHIVEEVYDEEGNLIGRKTYSRDPALQSWLPIVIIFIALLIAYMVFMGVKRPKRLR